MPTTEASAWFTTEQQPGLQDFWRVYDAHFDVVAEGYERAVPGWSTVRDETRERIRRAIAGAWDEYAAYLRDQGSGFARRGLSFSTWHTLAAAFTREVAPLLIQEYGGDPERLTAANLAMLTFADRAIAMLGEAYIGTVQAIANERRASAESGRRLAERRFDHLAESGILGIIVSRLDGAIPEINDAALAIVGYTRQEILSGLVRWEDLTPPEWRAVDGEAIEQLRTVGVSALREKEYVRKDGRRVPVLVGSAMIQEAEEEVISFVLDLTERKRASAVAERLRAQHTADVVFRTMVDSVSDYAIFMLDPEGRVATWNTGAERLKRYEADEIIGTHFSAFYTAEDNDRDVPAHELRVAIAEGRSELEGWRVRKDGSRFWANVVISAMRAPDGQIQGFTKVTRDLTDRKAAETALAAANQELEAFSYSVAHDLRAPLRGMNGFARLLLDQYGGQFDAEGKDWLQEILLNAKKMAELIDALLSLARVTRSELRPERVDLSALAADVARHLAEAGSEPHTSIVIEPGLTVDMDRRLARALLDNLMSNAWKFTRRSAEPSIEVGRVHDPGIPTFFVRDNGAGFDMAYAAKLFAPFQRLHTVAEFPGTGIGLATVQRIVRRHGGRVWAEGHVGRGATFSFTLPPGAAGAA